MRRWTIRDYFTSVNWWIGRILVDATVFSWMRCTSFDAKTVSFQWRLSIDATEDSFIYLLTSILLTWPIKFGRLQCVGQTVWLERASLDWFNQSTDSLFCDERKGVDLYAQQKWRLLLASTSRCFMICSRLGIVEMAHWFATEKRNSACTSDNVDEVLVDSWQSIHVMLIFWTQHIWRFNLRQ